jgi:16S rRNA (adenine1518-N6/adenine1519-N6)-dimethyltransferase
MKMDLTSPKTIKELLLKYEAKPSKGLGQNFLIDKNTLKKIVNSAGLKPTDTILEVGPGIGTLTRELAKIASRVFAVEKSQKMCEILKETLADFNNVDVINADILRYLLPTENYKVVANIPYYLTSPLIRKLLEAPPAAGKPEEIVLLMQKEVAQRICSKTPDMSLLSVSVQFYAEPKIIGYVSKNCFLPAPKIDSAIIKITPKSPSVLSPTSHELFFKVVKAGFLHPRKQLGNNLSAGLKLDREQVNLWLLNNKLAPSQRAETLSVQDWENLTKSFPQL